MKQNEMPLTDALPRVLIQIRCANEREFQERLAPGFAADGVFVPGEPLAPLGSALQVTIQLRNGHRVLSGSARVDGRSDLPAGTQLRFVRLDPGSVPLAPILAPVRLAASANASMLPPPSLKEKLFARVLPPDDGLGSKPLVIQTRATRLRLRSTL